MRPSSSADTAAPVPVHGTATARSAEYRHFGDDSALLTVAVQAHATALPGEARLIASDGREVTACAVTFQPEGGLARLVFAVDRGVAAALGASLKVVIGAGLPIVVPEPVKRAAIGVPDAELDHAIAAGVAGDELAGLLRVLERRATIAERIASDAREKRSDSVKVAQAYREIWEVRDLLESREDAYRRSADAVDAAEAAQREAEAAASAARAELEDVRGESQAATTRLEGELAQREADLAAARARVEELERERDEARAAAGWLEADVEEALAVADAAQAERDEAVAARDAAEAAREAAIAEAAAERDAREAAEYDRDEIRAERDAVAADRDAAVAERDDALDKLHAVKAELAAATADVAEWAAELEEARTRAADAEALLEAERTLHEARLAQKAGTERNLADLFAEAQRERLRQTPEDEQLAQVAALERQLARIKRDAGGATG